MKRFVSEKTLFRFHNIYEEILIYFLDYSFCAPWRILAQFSKCSCHEESIHFLRQSCSAYLQNTNKVGEIDTV